MVVTKKKKKKKLSPETFKNFLSVSESYIIKKKKF